MWIEIAEQRLRIVVIGKAVVGQARAAKLIGLLFEFGLDPPKNLLHQRGEVIVITLECFFEKLEQVLMNGVVANRFYQVVLVELHKAIHRHIGDVLRCVEPMHPDVLTQE